MKDKGTAIILGGSIAGIFAAKAISSSFEKVIIVERDDLAGNPLHRKGAAQAFHSHILLKRGLQAAENMFPGFTNRALAAGGVMTNASMDWYANFQRGVVVEFESDLDFLCASRPLIETIFRSMLLEAASNIETLDNVSVTSVDFDKGKPTVSILRSGAAHPERISADLIIDATGRNSKANQWLTRAGFGGTQIIGLEPKLGYATCILKNAKIPKGKKAMVVLARSPHTPAGGNILPIEGEQAICTLYGISGNYPPTDKAQFKEFAKTSYEGEMYEAIKDAEFVSDIKGFVKDSTSLKRYGTNKWPDGFLVIGDAVASFNPIYGQGMTSAILAAERLMEMISGYGNSGWSQRVQKTIVKTYETPWKIGYSEDMRWPASSKAGVPFALKLEHKMGDMINLASTREPIVADAFYRVLHMMTPPETMMAPKVLIKAWKGSRNQV